MQVLIKSDNKKNEFIGEVSIGLIEVSKHNPRKTDDEKHIQKLAEIINKNGFDTTFALKCHKEGDKYHVFAGGNRLKACRFLGKETVPVFLYEGYSEVELWKMAYDDNEQAGTQKQLSVVDVWMDYKAKYDSGMTQQQIADALEVSQKHVSRRLGYAVLPEVVLNSFRHNEILKEGHAHELCNLDKMSKSEWLNRALFLTEIIEGILNRNRKNEISANIFKSEVQKYNQAIEEYKKCRSELAESYHKEFDNLLNQGKTRSSSGIRRVATRILEKISKDRLEAERKRRAEINDLEAKRIEAEKAVERQKNTQSILERLFNEDAVSAIAKMPENIKLVFTDPPYGMGFQSGRREKTAKADKIKNDSSQDQANELLSKYLQAIYPKMEENSHLLVWCKWSSERHFMNIIESMGFELKGSVVWHKHNHGTGDLKGSFAPKHERIIHAVKGKPEFITRLPDVLNGVELLESDHPTPKPLDLIQNIVEALTYEKEIVVDGFMGSGSTGVATVRCGRVFYGSDLDNRWFNEAQENIYKVIK